MTITEAISRINTLKPNSYTDTEKIAWLSTLDGVIKKEIIDTHHDGEDVVFSGYNEMTAPDTVLLVPAPYDDIYIHWLDSRIDYTNGEYKKYNNTAAAYNDAYDAFARFYNKAHMPRDKGRRFLF